jgi:ribose transport system substrate-binding protein
MEKYLMNKMSRRAFLRTTLAAGATIVAGTGMVNKLVLAQDKVTVVNSIRSLKNPYHGTWNLGGRIFAESIGANYVTLLTEGDSQKGLADINALLAKTGGNMVLNVDPNQSPDATPIVKACVDAKVYVVTQWNKPDDLHPWDFNPNYVAHISFAGVPYGKATAEALFKSMGGEGGVVALGGLAANVPAIERKAGLDEALKENPKIELLDFQVADWDTGKALDITNTWLTKYGDKLKGIWAANDSMGFGALSALEAAKLDGKVLVTGIDGTSQAVENVLNKTFAATVAWNPFWQGGMGLSLGYHAKMGTFDPAKEPEEHREFYGKGVLITGENVEEYYNLNVLDVPRVDWEDLWGNVAGQIEYAPPAK